MRCNIVHPQADELIYEIRQIVLTAKKLEAAGVTISWENIGDPVAKNEQVPGWIAEHLKAVAEENRSWGYSPSKGMEEARQFVAELNNSRNGAQITPEEVYFYNGLGDAVSKLYGYLNQDARVLCPSPSYSIHATHEAFHAGKPPLLYHLDPANGWLPDIEEIRGLVERNPDVAAILLINPDNPTGLVWPEELVREVVGLAGQNGLFVIADEIYHRLVYNGKSSAMLCKVIGDVPAISLKGISKEYPWPGSRCGWMEIYNEDADPVFKRYVRSLFDAKMIEVCATTQPQMTVPRVMADERYGPHLEARCAAYGKRSEEFYQAFRPLEKVHAARPDGAFYASVILEEGALNQRQSLPVENRGAKEILEQALSAGVTPDKRLVLHLLAATGICVVPMTGFTSLLPGFRMTLLEPNDSNRAWVFSTLREKIGEYLASG
jgi:alanine-synthesizing transaminase